MVVLLAFDHFGREIIERPAQGVSSVVGCMDGPPEIRDLQLAFRTDQKILRLDVAMDDVLFVAVVKRRGEGGDVAGRFFLIETLLFLQLLVKLALGRELENQVHAVGVVEIRKQAQNVRVAQVGLNFNLSP